jgi:hypothetical protein
VHAPPPWRGKVRMGETRAAVSPLPRPTPVEGEGIDWRLIAQSSALSCQRGHHALGQKLDRPQHLGLFHTRPLDAEDEAVHPERLDVAP